MDSWLKEEDEHSAKEVPPDGYKIISNPRSVGRQGGSIAVVYRDYYTDETAYAKHHEQLYGIVSSQL